jgi:hypothetical protein
MKTCPNLLTLKLKKLKFNPILNNMSSIQSNKINKFCLLKNEPSKLIKNRIKVKLNKNMNVM